MVAIRGAPAAARSGPSASADVMQTKNVGAALASSPDASQVLGAMRFATASLGVACLEIVALDRSRARFTCAHVPSNGSSRRGRQSSRSRRCRGDTSGAVVGAGRPVHQTSSPARGAAASADNPARAQIHLMRADGGEACRSWRRRREGRESAHALHVPLSLLLLQSQAHRLQNVPWRAEEPRQRREHDESSWP